MARTLNKKQKFPLEDSSTSRQQPHSNFYRTLLILTLNAGHSYWNHTKQKKTLVLTLSTKTQGDKKIVKIKHLPYWYPFSVLTLFHQLGKGKRTNTSSSYTCSMASVPEYIPSLLALDQVPHGVSLAQRKRTLPLTGMKPLNSASF